MTGSVALLLLMATSPADSVDKQPFRDDATISRLISEAIAGVPTPVDEACGETEVVLRASLELAPSGEVDDLVIVGPDCATRHSEALLEVFRTAPADLYRNVEKPTYFHFPIRFQSARVAE